MQARPSKRTFHPIQLLLLIPFIALCWPAFYNTAEPQLAGLPFFYWYQLAWIILTAIITAIVYVVEA